MVVRSLQNLCQHADDVRQHLDVHKMIDQAIAMTVQELDSRAVLTRDLAPVQEIWGNESKADSDGVSEKAHA